MEKVNKCTPEILKFSTVNTCKSNKQKRIEKKEKIFVSKQDSLTIIENFDMKRAELIQVAYNFIKFENEYEKKIKQEKCHDDKKSAEIELKQLDCNSERQQFYLTPCKKLNEQNQTLVSIPATCQHQQQQQQSALFNIKDKEKDIINYYNNILPVDALIDLFNLNNAYKTQNRELMFTVSSFNNPESIFVMRNLNTNTTLEFIQRLVKSKPHQIDIGPIYEKVPEKLMKNKVIAREYLIDIDLSDYDEIRTCCKEKNMCQKCWKYAALACQILDKEIRAYWQYKHIMWVFSGRRGIHAWICDKKARESDVEDRIDITDFFSVVKSGNSKKRVKFRGPLHPLISDNFQLCFKFFVNVCIKEQDLLNDLENISYFLEQVPKVFRQDLLTGFKYYKTSLQRWNYFLLYYEKQMNNNDNNKLNKEFIAECKYLVEEIVIQYTFPRLDCPVSIQTNHVLKCPFSFHPKTGKIALVIKPEQVELFNPDKAPRVDEIVEQYRNRYKLSESAGLHKFKKSVEHFKNILIQIKNDEQQQQEK